MWDGIERRKLGFERRFGIEEELKFKAIVRASRLFGAWVAQQLDLQGAEAEVYALQMMDVGLHLHGQKDSLSKAELDLRAKGAPLSMHRLEQEFEICLGLARQQVGAIS